MATPAPLHAARRTPDRHRQRHAPNLRRRHELITSCRSSLVHHALGHDQAIRLFAKHIIDNHNGFSIIEALISLNKRDVAITKRSLKEALVELGISNLASGTTDHTTLLNWFIVAGIVTRVNGRCEPSDAELKALLGISATEQSELAKLPLSQQVFLNILRRFAKDDPNYIVATKTVMDECLAEHRDLFQEDQFSAKILKPLEKAGWVILGARSSKASGGKSGTVAPTIKLLDIPLEQFVPDFEAVIPASLRSKVDTPPRVILEMLRSSATYDRGVALELLAVRMLIDLGLQPRSFRPRSLKTAYAEIDVTAEGAELVFSRWNIQCKCLQEGTSVPLGDLAKEVGLAMYTKAHVVAFVTTAKFSNDALKFSREITKSTYLQFVLIDGENITKYLSEGPQALLDHVRKNAYKVMAIKGEQPGQPS